MSSTPAKRPALAGNARQTAADQPVKSDAIPSVRKICSISARVPPVAAPVPPPAVAPSKAADGKKGGKDGKKPSKAQARLERERKENLRRVVKDREWRFLDEAQRTAARLLGFPGEEGWNNDDNVGWAATPAWAAMSSEQRAAALALEFDEESWWGPPPWDEGS